MDVSNSQKWTIRNNKGLDGLALEEVSVPQPREHEVVVKIHAVSLNWRDVMVTTGTYMHAVKDHVIPCSDGAGKVVSVGPLVTRFKPGARVATTFFQDFIAGSLADASNVTDLGGMSDGVLRRYAVFDEQNLVEIPSHLSYAEGSTLPCAALTAWNCLFGPVNLMPGNTVLTQGTGGVSLFALQFAALAGAQVIATTSSAGKAKMLKQLGAHKVINYHEDPNWGETAKKVSLGRRGADIVVEVGGSNTMEQSLKAVAVDGHIAVVGTRAGQGGSTNFHSTRCTIRRIMVGSRLQFEQMCRAISVCELRPVIDPAEFTFEQAKEALQYLADQKAVGKVVIQLIPEHLTEQPTERL